jgi:conjugative transposon TraN protein
MPVTLVLGILFLLAREAAAQGTLPQNVEVTFNKTSTIIFPASIASVDRGSRDVLAQKAKGVNNVLQLKAARVNFKETNLTVITTDGDLHHFFIRYADRPSVFTIEALKHRSTTEAGSTPLLFESTITDAQFQRLSRHIVEKSDRTIKKKSRHQMKLELKGIYINASVMFFHINISNASNIPFDTEMLRFYIKDKSKAKRTAFQELTQTPINIYGNVDQVKGQSSSDIVYAMPKFTIPDAKALVIELYEKNGGRNLSLSVANSTIVKAQLIR